MGQRIIAILALTALTIGCNRTQQPVQNVSECPTCDDIEAERAHLASEVSQLRSLAERRRAIYDELRSELSELIDSGRVRLTFRRGMIVMQLPDEVLFRSGRVELKAEGREVLTVVGEAIASIRDRRFLVAGHTDDQPIQASNWTSNWHLSSARSLVVLDVLLEAGIEPEQIAAAGFGEYDPVTENDTPEGQAQNRRTEVMVVPNLERIYQALQNPSSNDAN